MPSITLRAGSTRLVVDVAAGARLAQVDVDGQHLLVGSDHPDGAATTGWGSYPMAPWAGRIRHGRFRFLDREVVLDRNFRDAPAETDPDGERWHAIHGTVFDRPWVVDEATDDRVRVHCPLGGALGWPFGGVARQEIALDADGGGLRCTLAVDADELPFPAEIGWHPWFLKPARLDFTPVAMYRQDDLGLPTGELVAPVPSPWDDCFVARGPVRLHYDRPNASVVTVDADTDHWVVYDRPPHATCVEPQSGPPDAPTIRPRVVVPGSPLRRTMTVTWRTP